jgi:hypothetical protein
MGENPFAAQSSGGSRQTDMDEADSFISVSSVPLQFPKVGFTVGGTILDYSFRDDIKDGERRFWLGKTPLKESEATAKGYPHGEGLVKLRVMLLELQLHDESLRGHKWEGLTYDRVELEEDDLIRTAWVRGSMRNALGKALQDAKAGGKGWIAKAPGAYVEWTRTKDGPKTSRDKQAPHTHTALWIPADKNPHQSAASMDDPWAKDAESTPF